MSRFSISFVAFFRFADKEPFTPKHSIGELEHMLSKDPKRYTRCRLNFHTYYLADAIPIGKILHCVILICSTLNIAEGTICLHHLLNTVDRMSDF